MLHIDEVAYEVQGSVFFAQFPFGVLQGGGCLVKYDYHYIHFKRLSGLSLLHQVCLEGLCVDDIVEQEVLRTGRSQNVGFVEVEWNEGRLS